jgi:hypothetical protein
MKKIIFMLFLYVIVLSPSLFGQGLEIEWERRYLAVPDTQLFSAFPFGIEPAEDGGFIIANHIKILHGQPFTRVFKVDREGEIIWEYVNLDNIAETHKSLVKLDNGIYVLLSQRSMENRIRNLELIFINDDGEEVDRRILLSDSNEWPFNLSRIDGNNLILIGRRSGSNGLVYKLDCNGNILETKTYAFGIGSVCQNSDESLLFVGHTNDREYGGNMALFETDINLDSVRYDIYDLNRDIGAGKIRKKPNGNVVVAGFEYIRIRPNAAVSKIFLSEFNSDRELIWFHRYWDTLYGDDFNDLRILPDNRIAFAGSTNLDRRWRGLLMLTDPEGNIIDSLLEWGDGWMEFRKMLFTPEGDLYIAGVTKQNFEDEVYYLTLQKIAYPTVVKAEGDVHPAEFGILSAFPNPFNSTTNIIFNAGVNQKLSVGIYDVYGRYITGWEPPVLSAGTQVITWNTAPGEIPSGVYNVIVTGADQFDSIQLVKIK